MSPLIILSHVLHHFSAARGRSLLKRLYRSLRPGGRIAVQEFVTDDGRARRTRQLLFALTMLLWTREGDAYSYGELRRMLQESGFRKIRFYLPEMPGQYIIGRKD